MATQAASHIGFITGNSQANQPAARDAAEGTATNSPSGDQNSIQYFQSSGRGGGTFRYVRTFFRFDTSGISGGSSFSLQVEKAAAGSTTKVFVVKSDAFNGEDNALAANDFNNLDFGVLYTATATGTTWAYGSGTNDVALNSTFTTFANANSVTRVALVGILDYNDVGLEEDGDDTQAIDFDGTIQLSYTAAATGYTHNVLGVAAANISKVDTVATANIDKINTVD